MLLTRFRNRSPTSATLLRLLSTPAPHHHLTTLSSSDTDRLAKLINDHPFPSQPLLPFLHRHLHPPLLTPALLDSLLTRLFSGHANGHKALELFRFSLGHHPSLHPSPRAFNTTLHILSRMRDFDGGWELLEEVRGTHPSLITLKSLAIVLAKYVKFRSFEDALEAFDRMEKKVFVGKEFGVDEFNVLVRAFCAEKKMMEARAVVRRLYHRFLPNARTLNILLLGFKETRNVMAMETFYNEMIVRGFKPDAVSYNIRIDAYCKNGKHSAAMEVLEKMGRQNFAPTLETMTTLIHGASIVRDPVCARRLFDELLARGFTPDIAAHNALMDAFLRSRDFKSGMEVMDDMEVKGIIDDVAYFTMFCALKKHRSIGDVCGLYKRMVEKNFVPKTRTVVMLMKYLCENRRPDLGLELWRYMVDKGCCPHGHALDLLVTGLCCRGKVEEALQCVQQLVERGRHPLDRGYRVLEGFLTRCGEQEKLEELNKMIKSLQAVSPPSKGEALYCSAFSIESSSGH